MQLHADVDGLLSWELAFVGTWEEDARAFRRDFSIGSSKMQSEARPLSACRRHMGVPSTSAASLKPLSSSPSFWSLCEIPLFDSSGESFRPGLRFGHSASVLRAFVRLGAGLLATAAMIEDAASVASSAPVPVLRTAAAGRGAEEAWRGCLGTRSRPRRVRDEGSPYRCSVERKGNPSNACRPSDQLRSSFGSVCFGHLVGMRTCVGRVVDWCRSRFFALRVRSFLMGPKGFDSVRQAVI